MGSNIIELNGKQYDALTGALLDEVPASYKSSVKQLAVHAQATHGGSMDGMVRAHKTAGHTSTHHVAKKIMTSRQAPKHVAAHKPQSTKTLMRHAVKAPVINKKVALKSQAPTVPQRKIPAKLAVNPKVSSEVVDMSRSKRAMDIRQSSLVQHFSRIESAPRRPLQHAQQTTSAQSQTRATHHPAATRAPQQRARLAHPTQSHRTSHQSSDIFEQALARATSHEQPSPRQYGLNAIKHRKRKLKKILSVSTSLAVFVLLVGFITYQNKASIELQVASAKAGFSASTPLYKPDGYKLGKLTYSPGTVALAYHGDNKTIDVIQKKSNWDSQTLLDNYVATSDESYQGYSSNGRTIYVYGKGNATWVNGGVWYQIHAGDALGDEELVKVAASM